MPEQQSSPSSKGKEDQDPFATTKSLLELKNPLTPQEMQQLQSNQRRQAKHYKCTAHGLPTLRVGDTVRMKPFALRL